MFEYESRFFAFTIFHYQDFIFMDTAHLHMALQISMTTVVVCMTFSNGKWLEGGHFSNRAESGTSGVKSNFGGARKSQDWSVILKMMAGWWFQPSEKCASQLVS